MARDCLRLHLMNLFKARLRAEQEVMSCAFLQPECIRLRETKIIMTRFLKYWLPVFFWMAVIFFMSTDAGSAAHTSRILEPLLHWFRPDILQSTIEEVHFYVRKGGHLSEYALLGILLLRALRATILVDAPLFKSGLAALLLAAAYAASDEFHQSFVPSRGASVRDVLIDTCGAFVGLCVVIVCIKLRRVRSK